MGYTTLLFDLDGTIMDFEAAQYHSFFDTFAHFSINADEAMHNRYDAFNSSLWQQLEHGEITRKQLFEQRFPRFLQSEGITGIDPDELQKQYFKGLSESCVMMEGAREILQSLYGKYQLCIITNGVASTQRKRLIDSGINDLFSHLIISEEIGFEKPDRRYFEAVKEICNISDPKTALVIGDSLNADIFGGASFGFDTCWYNPQNKPFNGKAAPSYTITALSDLHKIV